MPGQSHYRRQQQRFDAEFARYARYHLPNWRRAYIQRIFDNLRLSSEERFLDVGVGGSGYTVVEAARLGAFACGLDISPVGMERAASLSRESLQAEALSRCHFFVASAEQLPFATQCFNKVCCVHVLEHLPNHLQAMEELARVITPGGRLFVTTPHTYALTPFPLNVLNRVNDRVVGHLRHYSAEELGTALQERGFVVEEVIYHGHQVKLLQWLLTLVWPPVRSPDSRLWWALEECDRRQQDNPRAMNVSLVLRKR